MGKAIKIFEQKEDETNVIANFNLNNGTGWWEEM